METILSVGVANLCCYCFFSISSTVISPFVNTL